MGCSRSKELPIDIHVPGNQKYYNKNESKQSASEVSCSEKPMSESITDIVRRLSGGSSSSFSRKKQEESHSRLSQGLERTPSTGSRPNSASRIDRKDKNHLSDGETEDTSSEKGFLSARSQNTKNKRVWSKLRDVVKTVHGYNNVHGFLFQFDFSDDILQAS